MRVLVYSYFTPGRYARFYEALLQSAQNFPEHNYTFYGQEIPKMPPFNAICHRPALIRDAMRKFQGKGFDGLLFVDADAAFCRVPPLCELEGFDVVAPAIKGRILGGTLFFRFGCPEIPGLLDAWASSVWKMAGEHGNECASLSRLLRNESPYLRVSKRHLHWCWSDVVGRHMGAERPKEDLVIVQAAAGFRDRYKMRMVAGRWVSEKVKDGWKMDSEDK